MAGTYKDLESILGISKSPLVGFGGFGIGGASRLKAPVTEQDILASLSGYTVDENGFVQEKDPYGFNLNLGGLNPKGGTAQAPINTQGFSALQLYNNARNDQDGAPSWVAAAERSAYNRAYGDYWDQWDKNKELGFLRKAPVAQKNTGGGNANLLTKELNALLKAAPGYSLKNKAGGNQEQISRLVPDLARFGVNSLFDIKSYQVPDPQDPANKTTTVFYDNRNGRILPREFGSSMKGKGGSEYYLNAAGPLSVPGTSWMDTSERDTIAGVLGVLSLGLSGPALGALQGAGLSAAQAGAVYGAGSGALQSAATGQNALKGALLGGATGYLGGSIGSGSGQTNLAASLGVDNATAQAIVNGAIKAGGSAALQSAINGNNLGDSLLGGVIQGGVSGGLGQALGGGALSQYGANAVGKMLSNKLVPQDRKSTLNNQALMNRRPLGVNIPQVRTSSGGDLSQGIANYQSLTGQRQGRVNSAIDKIFGDLAPVYKVRYS